MARPRTTGRWYLAGLLMLGTAGVALVVVRAGREGAQPELPPDVGVVDFVIDGDTIDIEIGGRDERVRLIGINTPETHVEDGLPECFGPEAAQFTHTILPVGAQVRLTRDVVGRDDYGRLLAYVYRRDDDLFVNEAIVAGGFARPLTIRPNDAYASVFVARATEAEAGDLGLWRACSG